MKTLLLSALILTLCISARAQKIGSKFLPGCYYDINGQKVNGLIRSGTGKPPVKDEGFITFKADENAEKQNLSASMIHSFVIGPDSFIVAHAPHTGPWTRNDLDFIQVAVNSPLKLYAIDAGGNSGGSSGISPGISTGFGLGGGTVGGIGTGIGLSLGSGMFGHGGGGHVVYYYGSDTSSLTELKKQNFIEVMSEVMADKPEAVDKIKDKTYKFGNIEKLIKYYNDLHAND